MTFPKPAARKSALLENTRDQLADDFARCLFDIAPDVAECIEFSAQEEGDISQRRAAPRAAKLLVEHRRPLQFHAATAMRRIFDEKLALMLDSRLPAARSSLDNLTLLSDERLDEEIAVSVFSRRLKEQCGIDCWSLTQRLAGLTRAAHPADRHNPVFPQTFAQSLLDAIGMLDTDATVRLLLFKSFGPTLLDIVPSVYARANELLKSNGFDVDLRDYNGRTASGTQTPAAASTAGAIDSNVSNTNARDNRKLASTLIEILAQSGSGLPVYAPPGTTAAAAAVDPADIALTFFEPPVPATSADSTPSRLTTPAVAAVAPPVAATDPVWYFDLMNFGASAGESTAMPATGAAPAAAATPPRHALRRTLHDARHSLRGKLSVDEQVISDIITVMFDRLNREPRLPAKLRGTVARLQLPVLQMALKDRSLLTQVEHPVRRLIDLIAEFGLTMGQGADDGTIVRSVANIVDGLVNIHDTESDAFRLAFELLDSLFYHHEEAALQTSAPLRVLEREEALDYAGARVDREIALRLHDQVIPAAIGDFIRHAWRDVLVHDYLHGGPKGEPWKMGLATLDDIVKSLKPDTDENERARLARNLPAFIELLLNTPDTIEDVDVVAANFFAELQRAHALAIAGKWQEIGGEKFEASAEIRLAGTTVLSPSTELTAMGLACGDWVEIDEGGDGGDGSSRRWRLNWVTSLRGTCVFKHYESGETRHIGCDTLRDKVQCGEVRAVRGLGLADDMINEAFRTISRKTRREQSRPAARDVSDMPVWKLQTSSTPYVMSLAGM